MPISNMALHAARVIRQRHKADSEAIETDISPEQRKNLEDAFEAADKNGDGVLSADEYYEIFQTHGLTIDKEWIQRTIAQNDKDGDGGISLEEFIEMNIRGKLKSGHGGAGASDASSHKRPSTIAEKAKLAFNVYDRNRDGYLTKAELRKTSKRMTDAQIDAVFEKYDKNKDGKLDFNEFKDLMEARSKSQEEEDRTIQHQQQEEYLHQQSSSEMRSSHPTSPARRKKDKGRLSSHMSIDRDPSPRRKSSSAFKKEHHKEDHPDENPE